MGIVSEKYCAISAMQRWSNQFDHGGINQVNQYVRSQRHKTKSYAKLSGKQVTLHSVKEKATLGKPVEKRRV